MACNQNLLPHIIECDFNKVTLGQFINAELHPKTMTDDDEEDNTQSELINFSISCGQYILYEEDEYNEDDE